MEAPFVTVGGGIGSFVSYAIREAFSTRSVSGFCSPLWQVLVEPVFRDYYTPRAGQVFAGLQREHDRISYGETVAHGQVRMIRRRLGGGQRLRLPPGARVSIGNRSFVFESSLA